MKFKEKIIKFLVIISFIFMIFINAISFLVPVHGRTMLEISFSYPILYAPADYAHSIWGVIYISLFAFIIYQSGLIRKQVINEGSEILYSARLVFITTCLLNSSWLLAWLYDYLAMCVMIIFIMLLTLKIYSQMLSEEKLSTQEKIYIRMPFSIYYAWILITTVSTILIMLGSIRWNGWGLSDELWVVIDLLIVSIATCYRSLKNKDIIFGLTILWSYIGILVRHISQNMFAGAYPSIIITTLVGIIMLSICVAYLLFYKKKESIGMLYDVID